MDSAMFVLLQLTKQQNACFNAKFIFECVGTADKSSYRIPSSPSDHVLRLPSPLGWAPEEDNALRF